MFELWIACPLLTWGLNFSDQSPRVLHFRFDVPGGNTAERCTALCASKGYGLAGLEYGNECCKSKIPQNEQAVSHTSILSQGATTTTSSADCPSAQIASVTLLALAIRANGAARVLAWSSTKTRPRLHPVPTHASTGEVDTHSRTRVFKQFQESAAVPPSICISYKSAHLHLTSYTNRLTLWV